MIFRIFLLFTLGGLVSYALPDTRLLNDGTAITSADRSSKLIFINPFSGTHKGISMWWHRFRLFSDSIFKQRTSQNYERTESVDIEQALDLLGLPAPLPGKIDYLVDGSEFFPALYQSIDRATEGIDTQVFIFDNDDVATKYADRLKKRSREVKCRVLMDRLGSVSSWWIAPKTPLPQDFQSPPSMPRYLMEGSKVRARVSQNPWLVADHTKLIMIDGKEAYLGGMNIGRESRYEWHDLMVRVRGPVTTELQNHFNRSWRLQGLWGDWSMPFYRKLKPAPLDAVAGQYPIRLLRTTPARTEIEEALLTAIRMSRERIYLQNSYATSELLLQELLAARGRGVEVNFIFPEVNDSKFMATASRRFAAALLKADCHIYAYPKFTHVKAAIIDNWACLGSANLDGLSMRINGELNIAYSDPEAVETLRQKIFLEDIRASRKLKRGELKVPFNFFENIVLPQL